MGRGKGQASREQRYRPAIVREAQQAKPWKRVVLAAECREADHGRLLLCPACGKDYRATCSCPGPTMDDHEYRTVDGVLYARPKKP